MRFAYAESFRKTVVFLSHIERKRIRKTIQRFEDAWERGDIPQGVGLTHLRGDFYEFRIDIHGRVLFQRSGDVICYILCGGHDDIRRFLKHL